jgi:hypothetical protein
MAGSECSYPIPRSRPAMLSQLRARAPGFWDRVIKGDGCWLWLGSVDEDGYGRLRLTIDRRRVWMKAHRVSWALDRGRMPGPRMLIRHRCDTPGCVRPNHLRRGTQLQNVRERVLRGRSACGEQNGRARLRETDVLEIRARLLDAASVSELAREYSVSPKAIREVRDRKTWKHL